MDYALRMESEGTRDPFSELAQRRREERMAVEEGGGGESEGFELSEQELIDHASHGDEHRPFRIMRDAGPEEEAVGNELASRLRAKLALPPPREGTVFCLRYFEDLSYQDIAELLTITPGAVAAALCKARSKLETYLQEPAVREAPIEPNEASHKV